ncbi:hypothetical protein Bbelb_047220 [Branchiostoma belcheri]|nr:hypothetical protein Bbelb_047220 [Branchiostoma belcheri]
MSLTSLSVSLKVPHTSPQHLYVSFFVYLPRSSGNIELRHALWPDVYRPFLDARQTQFFFLHHPLQLFQKGIFTFLQNSLWSSQVRDTRSGVYESVCTYITPPRTPPDDTDVHSRTHLARSPPPPQGTLIQFSRR